MKTEVHAKLIDKGMDAREAFGLLGALRLDVVAFDAAAAEAAASLRPQSRRLGLSFADRACLALASRDAATAVTADQVWASLDGLACTISLIR